MFLGMAEINAASKDLTSAGVETPATSLGESYTATAQQLLESN